MVTSNGAGVRIQGDPDAQGWYFYGITRSRPQVDAPVQLLEFAELAAVVRPVLLAEFDTEALRERLQDASQLEASVRSHNRVIEAIHAQQAILPAKFGMVYARADDVMSALRPAHDTLLDELHRLEGRDEWAVHVYADRGKIRERIASEDPAIQLLREQRDAARPGRAYFLEQQLRDALELATETILSTLARSVHDQLARSTIASQVTPVRAGAEPSGELEILKASFLVARDAIARFEAEVSAINDARDSVWCECTGPWPPYSFAASQAGGAE